MISVWMRSCLSLFLTTYVELCVFVCLAQQGEWSAEKAFLDQQVSLLEQQSQEKASRLEDSITSLQTERQMLQDRVVCFAPTYFFQRFICTL